jgi:SAM-dependent methyltransferase
VHWSVWDDPVAMERTISQRDGGIWMAMREAYRNRIPRRYQLDSWDLRLRAALAESVEPEQRILDVGSGAKPTLPPESRPRGVRYVGLDPSREELEKAPSGSYDDLIVAPAEQHVPGHDGEFDLAVSFMAFEHIQPLDVALNNIRAYLRPGGRLIAQLAGGRSPFALTNRLIPFQFTRRVLGRVQNRRPESVFPSRYDRCTYSGLSGMLSQDWSEAEVVPIHNAYGYVEFSRVLRALYIGFEEWAQRGDHREIASCYLIKAVA